MSEERGKNQGNDKKILMFGCSVAGLLMLGTVVVLAVIAVPNYLSMNQKAKRAEIPLNLKGIKMAQLAYQQEFDVYVSARPYPPYPSKTTQPWMRSASDGFAVMDWSPDGDVRGSYWVDVGPTNFTVTGICDVDGDGVFATYVATKSENPNAPITAPNIY